MNYQFFIALRYLKAKRRQAAMSIITFIAIAGIALGTGALIVAQALITGFRTDVQQKILSGTAHINLLKSDNGGIENYRSLIEHVKKVDGVNQVSATIYVQALIVRGDQQEPIVLKGIDPQSQSDTNDVFSTIVNGNKQEAVNILNAKTPPPSDSTINIFVGSKLAETLGLRVNDLVTIVTIHSRVTPMGVQPRPRYTECRIAGIFSSGLFEYDSKWAYLPLESAQRLSDYGGEDLAGVIQLKIDDIYSADSMAATLKGIAGSSFATTNWQELNRPLFAALQLQHRMVVVFFSLLIAIAALNIITALTMMVIEKHKDIAILRAQGATPSAIRNIFIMQGGIIGVIGAGLGLILGLIVSWIGNKFHLVSIPPEIYSVSHITLKIQILDCLAISLLAVVICLLATLFPSRTASRVTPVEALRYE